MNYLAFGCRCIMIFSVFTYIFGPNRLFFLKGTKSNQTKWDSLLYRFKEISLSCGFSEEKLVVGSENHKTFKIQNSIFEIKSCLSSGEMGSIMYFYLLFCILFNSFQLLFCNFFIIKLVFKMYIW